MGFKEMATRNGATWATILFDEKNIGYCNYLDVCKNKACPFWDNTELAHKTHLRLAMAVIANGIGGKKIRFPCKILLKAEMKV